LSDTDSAARNLFLSRKNVYAVLPRARQALCSAVSTICKVVGTATDPSRLIAALGEDIEAQWRRCEYEQLKLAEIGERTLRDHALQDSMSAVDIIQWANSQPRLPRQHDPHASFGQPPVTLYDGARFYLAALIWLDSATAIHSHSFVGAFQVLEGSSLHSVYEFREVHRINEHLILGDLPVRTVEHLRRGDVRAILPGNEFIHSTCHIEVPTVSLVVRSKTRASFESQFVFHPPGLAVDSFFECETTRRRCQLLKTLWDLRHPLYQAELLRLIGEGDVESAIEYLQVDLGLQTREACEPALATLLRRFASHEIVIDGAMKHFSREMAVKRLRLKIRDARLRFFIGTSLLAPNQRMAFDLLSKRFPSEAPIDVIVESAMRLSGPFQQISGLRLSENDIPALRSLLGDCEAGESVDADCVSQMRKRLSMCPIMETFI
jgi:hypothetical protein